MFVANCRRCPLPLKLMTFVLNVLKSCMLYPLSLTQLIFFVKFGHPVHHETMSNAWYYQSMQEFEVVCKPQFQTGFGV
ncbi:hypothetical protein Hanom_Chr14g01299211 [Helianthus anomalus]